MAIKVTFTSSDPNFILFDQWIEAKKTEAQSSGNTAEYNKIQAAMAEKEESVTSGFNQIQPFQVTEAFGITTLTTITSAGIPVDSFDFYWKQWTNEFNVQSQIDHVDDE